MGLGRLECTADLLLATPIDQPFGKAEIDAIDTTLWRWVQVKGLTPDGDALTQRRLEGLGYYEPEKGEFSPLAKRYVALDANLRVPSSSPRARAWWTHWLLMTNPASRLWETVFYCLFPPWAQRSNPELREADRIALNAEIAENMVIDQLGMSHLKAAADEIGMDHADAIDRLRKSARSIYDSYDNGLIDLDFFRDAGPGQKNVAFRLPPQLPKRLVTVSILDCLLDRDQLTIDELIDHPHGPVNVFGLHPEIAIRFVRNLKRHTVVDEYSNIFYSSYVAYCSDDVLYKTHHFRDAITGRGDLAAVMTRRHHLYEWAWEQLYLDEQDHDPGDCFDNRNLGQSVYVVPPYENW